MFIFVSFFFFFFFFFNDTATTEIYTLSLHDALPISSWPAPPVARRGPADPGGTAGSLRPAGSHRQDRKSTRLNSSHPSISYAVFCLKKKNNTSITYHPTKKKNDKQNLH